MNKGVIFFSVLLSIVTICAVKHDFFGPPGSVGSFNRPPTSKIEKKKNVRDLSIHVIGGHRAFMHGK